MTLRQLKSRYFIVEGMNSLATSYYFYYLFFFLQRQFGFGNLGNLSIAALNGLIYTFAAWIGGRFGQRYGYFRALRIGYVVLTTGLTLGAMLSSVAGQVAVLVTWSVGVCFTWPMLEALASDHEDGGGLQKMIGIYNLVWAGCSACSYFLGGLLIEKLGVRSIFWIPASIHLIQLGLVCWLAPRAKSPTLPKQTSSLSDPVKLNPRPIARTRLFLRMAWTANPLAYVAINTVAAVVPSLARKLTLTPMWAGFFCSVWFFARVGTFLVLWLWTGWHYRLRWFFAAYALLVASFAAILLVPQLAVVVLAQVAFGIGVGLIYYSSLYYSMDAGEAKGEHGGVHESAIGAGIFAGPAIGATALKVFPEYANSGTWAVSLTLCAGMVGLLMLAFHRRPPGLAR